MGTCNVAVVHELLHACYNCSKLFARDDLQGLHIDLAVLGITDGMEEVAGLVVVTLHEIACIVFVLTNACTVDADVAREAHIDVSLGESFLVSYLRGIESLESVVPSGTESNEQDSNVIARLLLLFGNHLVVDRILRHNVVNRLVVLGVFLVVTIAASCEDRSYHCHGSKDKEINLLHSLNFV